MAHLCEEHGVLVYEGRCPDCIDVELDAEGRPPLRHRPGEPTPKRGSWEEIGPSECPLMYRRTLLACRWFKVLVHRFMPGASDEAAHDHPRSFVTIVLRGGYDDIALASPTSMVLDEVRAPTVRFRRAEHAHITRVGPEGATTLVFMGRLRREWGFWKDGKWHEWRAFERMFGLNWRCPE